METYNLLSVTDIRSSREVPTYITAGHNRNESQHHPTFVTTGSVRGDRSCICDGEESPMKRVTDVDKDSLLLIDHCVCICNLI